MLEAAWPSIVIFTYRRHPLVRRIAEYYGGYEGELIVVDGSPEPIEGLRLPARGQYLHRPGMSGYARIHEGIMRVTAPTCALAADDDFQSPACLRASAAAIEGDPSVVCAAGTTVYFADGRRSVRDAVPDGAVERILSVPADAPPLERFRRTIACAPQVYFACIRTAVARKVSGFLADLPDEGGLVGEQLWTSLPALFGRTVLVPRLQMCRRIGFRDYSGYLQPFRRLEDLADWPHYGTYGRRLAELAGDAGLGAEDAERVVASWREFAAATALGERARRAAQPSDAGSRIRRTARNLLQSAGVAVTPAAWRDRLERTICRGRAMRPVLRSRAYPWSDDSARAEFERIMAFDAHHAERA
jgi:glycosyltransferase domain-containing protein